MTANVSIITLGVGDLAISTKFYEDLGWTNTSASQDGVSFLQGHSVVLGLYGHEALAEDAGVKSDGQGFRGVALAVNLKNEAAVDSMWEHAVACGARSIKKPKKVFWGGYSGYFGDPDGHLWEVAYNPFFQSDPESGQLALEGKN